MWEILVITMLFDLGDKGSIHQEVVGKYRSKTTCELIANQLSQTRVEANEHSYHLVKTRTRAVCFQSHD